MACGNNHVSRAQVANQPDPAEDPRRVAAAALNEAARLENEIRAVLERSVTDEDRERAARIEAEIEAGKLRVAAAGPSPGTHVGNPHDDPRNPAWASAYYSRHPRTGEPKIDVFMTTDGMPQLGNVYPHVHYYEHPGTGEAGAIASLEHGNGSQTHVGGVAFEAGTDARIVSEQLNILRQAIVAGGTDAAAVQNEVERLRAALSDGRDT